MPYHSIVMDKGIVNTGEGVTLTKRTRAGLSPILLSNTFRAPDIESETISSPLVQALPTCWWLTPDPRVQTLTALRDSTSPV